MTDETWKIRRARIGLAAIAAMALLGARPAAPALAQAADESEADASGADESGADASGADASDGPSASESAAPATQGQEGEQDEEQGEEEEEEEDAEENEEDQAQAEGVQADQAEATEETAEGLASADPAQQEEAAEEAQAAREPLPWRNSFFTWTHGVTPNTFIRDAQLSYNPFYYWSFNLAPRWYLDASTFFFVSQSLSYELTQDDGSSSYNHDLSLTDTVVELRRTVPWEGIIFIPAVRVLLPASKASQAAQRYFALAGGLTAVQVIPEAASLTIALIGRYQYWFAGSNVPLTQGDYPAAVAGPSVPDPEGIIDPLGNQASGLTSARHVITAGLNVTITPASGLTVSTAAFWQSQEGHGLATACTEVATSPSGGACFGDASATHWRHFTYLSLSVAYDVQPWFNLSLGWGSATVLLPLFAPDGSVYSPFNPDNNFMLSATFQIDGIYEVLTTGGEDDGLTPEQRQRRRQGLAGRSSSGGAL